MSTPLNESDPERSPAPMASLIYLTHAKGHAGMFGMVTALIVEA